MENKKLDEWKRRINADISAYQSEYDKMDERERLYRGDNAIKKLIENQKIFSTPHVRNICAELIEAQVDSSIPQPKVTAKRKEDEPLAKLIEDMLRNELDRLPCEIINDMTERTSPIQGGAYNLIEWDNTKRTHTTVGELSLITLHPKQVVPQNGVVRNIEDMDHITLRIPQTKAFIKRRYGKDVSEEGEEEPEIRGIDVTSAEDMATQYIVYYRNGKGGIGKYSWVGDTELEDLDDYQARRLTRCKLCGAVKPFDSDTCKCGSIEFEEKNEDYEEVYESISGETISSKIPFYKPDIYPIILFRNVSLYGSLLGDSDIDKIKTNQNVTNRLHAKIIEKLIKTGSKVSLPDAAVISTSEEDMDIIRPGSVADAEMINVYNLEANISQDMAYLNEVYEEARQVIGITDSFQGRADRTATSGKAKEFAAAQSAGRLESKRIMKDASWAYLFEVMFKFKLAYQDEPRSVLGKDGHGEVIYEQFNKWDFLKRDEAGEYYWNTDFIFSCEPTSPLASNREAMWQETRMNFESGTFGNPQEITTLIFFWKKMEQLHYPGAAEMRTLFEDKLSQNQVFAERA